MSELTGDLSVIEIPLTEDLKQALLPWMDKSFLSTAVPIVPPIPQVRLMTDASGSGWGAVCQTPSSSEGDISPSASSHGRAQRMLHSCANELRLQECQIIN